MKRAALALALLLAMTGCGKSASVQACTDRMRADLASGVTVTSRPPECKGISDAKLAEIVNQLMTDQVDKG